MHKLTEESTFADMRRALEAADIRNVQIYQSADYVQVSGEIRFHAYYHQLCVYGYSMADAVNKIIEKVEAVRKHVA